jgi:hypothetical protein
MAKSYRNAFDALAGRLIERLESSGSNDRRAHIMLSEMQQIADATQRIQDVAKKRNPMDTELQHLRKLADAAKKLEGFVEQRKEYISELYTKGLADLYDARDMKAGLAPHEHCAEMRAVFRSMNEEQKGAAVRQAMKDGDSDFISAICLCPPILSGVPGELRDGALKHIRSTKAPDLTAAIDDLDAAWQTANAVTRSAKSVCHEHAGHPKLRGIEEAEAALEGANNALAGQAA